MTTADFEDLLRAHALAALSPHERGQLDRYAASDPDRARRVALADAVLDAFALESDLLEAASAAGEAAEDNDPTLRRLTTAAAAAEGELRARLWQPVAPAAQRPLPNWRRRIGYTALAIAAALLLWLGLNSDGPSTGLDTGRPDDLRVGAALHLVLLQPTLTEQARTISWAAVPGASGYHASILDAAGAIVLDREASLQRSTAWELTPDDYSTLLQHRPLRLRVTALDGVELPIGSSGDLELTLR